MIVVTGGAGFIGSNVLAALEEHEHYTLVVVDRLRNGDKWHNIAKRELADVVAPENLFSFLESNKNEVEIVIHMAAVSTTTEIDADKIVANNFGLSLALWEWCATTKTRLIYASSAATYGDGSSGFEDDFSDPKMLARLRPLNAYAWSKHLFDRCVQRRFSVGGTQPPQWVGLKFFNVYGPNEYHKGTQASIAAQIFPYIVKGQPCSLFRSHNPQYPDGCQMRDFIYVDDCIDVILWLVNHPMVSGLFNVGTGQARTFYDLALIIHRILGQEPRIQFVDIPFLTRDRYQYFTQARINRLRDVGYKKPFTAIEDGITHYIKTYLTNTDRYR